MTPTKLLIGQILVVFAIMILGLWAATQWAAFMLAYQPELGSAYLRHDGPEHVMAFAPTRSGKGSRAAPFSSTSRRC